MFYVPNIEKIFPNIGLEEDEIKNIIFNALKAFFAEKFWKVDDKEFKETFGISKGEFKNIAWSLIKPEQINIEFFNVTIDENLIKWNTWYDSKNIVIDRKEVGELPVYYDKRTTGWEVRIQVILPPEIKSRPPLYSESSKQQVEMVPIEDLAKKPNLVPFVAALASKVPLIVLGVWGALVRTFG